MQVIYKRKKAWLRERAEGVVNEKETRRYTKTWIYTVDSPGRHGVGKLFEDLRKNEQGVYRRRVRHDSNAVEEE